MTDQLRQAIRSAMAFADVFIGEATREINEGGNSIHRRRAAEQLYAALENIEVVEETHA